MASLVFPGYSETTPGNAIPFGGPQNVYQIYDDLSWTKGKHQFKFGGDYIQTRDNRVFGAYENAVESLASGGSISSAAAKPGRRPVVPVPGRGLSPRPVSLLRRTLQGHYVVNSGCSAEPASGSARLRPQQPL